MVTVPDTVAPLAGTLTLTVGAVVSPPGRLRPDCWVCGVAALACAKVVVDVVVALATSRVSGADNCMVDVPARACWLAWSPAVGRPSMVWLLSIGLDGGLDASSVTACPNWRRANAATAHAIGESTGVRGLSVPNGSKPANANPPNTTLPTAGPGGVGSSGAAEITSAALTSADDTAEMRVGNAVPGGGAAGRST